jgi:hypothetical protein
MRPAVTVAVLQALAAGEGQTVKDLLVSVRGSTHITDSTLSAHLKQMALSSEIVAITVAESGLKMPAVANKTQFFFTDLAARQAGVDCARKIQGMLRGESVDLGRAPLHPKQRYAPQTGGSTINGLVTMSGCDGDTPPAADEITVPPAWAQTPRQQEDVQVGFDYARTILGAERRCFFLKHVEEVMIALTGSGTGQRCPDGKAVKVSGDPRAVYCLHQGFVGRDADACPQSPHLDDVAGCTNFAVIVNLGRAPTPCTRMGAPNPLVGDVGFTIANHPGSASGDSVETYVKTGAPDSRGAMHFLSRAHQVARQLEESADATMRRYLDESLGTPRGASDDLRARGGARAFGTAHWHWGPRCPGRLVLFVPMVMRMPGHQEPGNLAERIDSNRVSYAMVKHWLYGRDSPQYYFALCLRLLDPNKTRRYVAFCHEIAQEGPPEIFPWNNNGQDAAALQRAMAAAAKAANRQSGGAAGYTGGIRGVSDFAATARGAATEWVAGLLVYFALDFYGDCARLLQYDGCSPMPAAQALRVALRRPTADGAIAQQPFGLTPLSQLLGGLLPDQSNGLSRALRDSMPGAENMCRILEQCVPAGCERAGVQAHAVLRGRLNFAE